MEGKKDVKYKEMEVEEGIGDKLMAARSLIEKIDLTQIFHKTLDKTHVISNPSILS